jgi:hypothetical protein
LHRGQMDRALECFDIGLRLLRSVHGFVQGYLAFKKHLHVRLYRASLRVRNPLQ